MTLVQNTWVKNVKRRKHPIWICQRRRKENVTAKSVTNLSAEQFSLQDLSTPVDDYLYQLCEISELDFEATKITMLNC